MSEQLNSSIEQTTSKPPAAGGQAPGLRPYLLTVTLAGAVIVLYSLPGALAQMDAVFLTLCALTALAGPLAVRFRLPGRMAGGLAITVSDCFTFLGLVLVGPEAAVTLAALDALSGTFSMLIRKPSRCLFNIGQMAIAIFVAAQMYSVWGPDRLSGLGSTALSLALCAAVYFVLSDALVAVAVGLSSQQSIAGLFAKLTGKLVPAFALVTAAAVAATAPLPQIAALLAALALLALARRFFKRIDPDGLAKTPNS